MAKHNAAITISRPQGGGEPCISIEIHDKDAKLSPVKLEIPLEGFAEALTGLSRVSCTMITRNLDRVGKQRETQSIEFELADIEHYYKADRKEAAIACAPLHVDDDWICDTYYSSQNSFFERNGKQWARTSAYRWVEK